MRIAAQILYGRRLLSLLGAALCALLSWYGLVLPLDRIAYDTANEASPLAAANDLLIVAIDERSLLELGRWPWPRERHVELLRRLAMAEVAAVAIDVVFAEPDVEYPEVDTLLGEEIERLGRVVLPVYMGQADRGGQLLEIEPIAPLSSAARALGHVHIEVDSDGVARSVYLREGLVTPHWQHFSVALGNVLGLELSELPGVSENLTLEQSSVISIVRSHQNLVPYMGPAGSVDSVSYVDVIKGRIPARALTDKIVFVGATAAGHADNISTSLGQISGVEINANIFQALRTEKLTQPVSRLVSALLSFTITLITILLFTRLEPRALLFAVLLCVILVPLASILLLRVAQLWFSPAPVVLIVLLAYPLWNWLRLDAAVDFMHDQLKLLQTENRNADFSWDWEHLQRTAGFLHELGRVRDWQLGESPTQIGVLDSEPQWHTAKGVSTRYFTLLGETRLLALTWKSGQQLADNQLQLIFQQDQLPAGTPRFGGDIIDTDIAQLDTAYSEARHYRELVSSTLAQLSNGVIMSDMSGSILILNEQARSLLALHQENRKLLDVLQRVELNNQLEINQLLASLVLEGIAFNEEGKTLDGGRDLLCRGRLIRLDRPMLLISLTDVTDLKASEKSRAEALNFLSHDLRAPLTSVLALIEGAKSEHPDQLNLELLENIERYVQNNLAYAENFTQLARLENTDQPRFDECDAQSLIDNAVSLIFHAASGRGIKIQVNTCEEDIWINCNRSVLERALLNLLDNALKHSGDNSTIAVSLTGDDSSAIIEVSDQGFGIPPEETETIFGKFQQGSQAKSGVGLGLRFVSAALKTHKGTISVASEVGRGSTFTVKIPRQISHPGP